MNNIKYSKTEESVKDSKSFPIVTVSYLEKKGDVAIAEPYGIHGSTPKKSICLMFTINNDEANRMIIPLSALTRTRNLKEGEFECGNFVVGSIITFDENGNITIQSNNDINIAPGSGEVYLTGNLNITGDIIAGTVSLKNHIHSGVTTGISNSGPPVP